MSTIPLVSRSCRASSSRIPLTPKYLLFTRTLSTLPPPASSSVPFFMPAFGLNRRDSPHAGGDHQNMGKGKGKQSQDPEEEVDDREWDMRVARAMLHLRETLPLFFSPEYPSATMFPPHIFSRHVVLKLPPPLPLKISSLAGYSMAFSLARNGMHALHTDLRTDLERLTFSPSPADAVGDNATSLLLSRRPIPSHRRKQIRVLVSVHGSPRLPPHKEAQWQTSSLYTFSPYSGLIISHEVETIRPLPGEGVAEWLMSRLLGWTARQHGSEGAIPCPRTAIVPHRDAMASFKRNREEKGQ